MYAILIYIEFIQISVLNLVFELHFCFIAFSEESVTITLNTPEKQRSLSECANSSAHEEQPRTPHK